MTRAAPLLPALVAAALVACASVAPPGPASEAAKQSVPALEDPPRRPGKPLVLIAMPDSPAFRAVRAALVNEVKKEFDVITQLVGARTTAAELGDRVQRAQAASVVLMDNPTLKLYREYGSHGRPASPLPPAVVVMSSFLEEISAQLQNVTGVAYEVPGVTAFVNLRSVVERPVNRVGVIHRPVFRQFIGRQKALAAKEKIELVALEVPADPTPGMVGAALRQLRTSGRVDALWVLNDNRLLRDAAFVETAWRQELAAFDAPVIVGVPTLVSREAHFGNFAVLPDLAGLGVQAGNVIFELSELDWRADELPVELPLSTLTVANIRQLQQSYGLREGARERIDRVID